MTKYQILIKIIDTLRNEAPEKYSKLYALKTEDEEAINQARARTFIHLYLKVSFGLLDFEEREHYITDGTNDGGVDGYFINRDNKTIYFIQSKFRNTKSNFEEKKIELEEILVMDVNRILDGENENEVGAEYNGKIKQLIREISSIDGIGRYTYRVILLANLPKISDFKLKQLTGGFVTEIFDHENCYSNLVFPILAGTYFNASDLNINIDLSNKNAGSKISYTVQTKKGECEITVLFVPTIEIGRIMFKYKNSILKFNPRSYLDFEGKKVNTAIRETIIKTDTNEFALFNNGITMLSDETYINEKIGQKNKAQLTVKNPQIINGGQTSFTLSRIYQEFLSTNVEEVFNDKEVLVKIITLLDNNDDKNKIELIEEISTATNQQTPVINADRFSNEKIQLTIQKVLFDRYGLLYERKRGEFGDGVYNSYIDNSRLLERNLFFRNYFAANGNIALSRQKKLFLKQKFTEDTLLETDKLDRFYFGYLSFPVLAERTNPNRLIDGSISAKVFAFTEVHKPKEIDDFGQAITQNSVKFQENWSRFINRIPREPNTVTRKKNKKTGEEIIKPKFSLSVWYENPDFVEKLKNYYD